MVYEVVLLFIGSHSCERMVTGLKVQYGISWAYPHSGVDIARTLMVIGDSRGAKRGRSSSMQKAIENKRTKMQHSSFVSTPLFE